VLESISVVFIIPLSLPHPVHGNDRNTSNTTYHTGPSHMKNSQNTTCYTRILWQSWTHYNDRSFNFMWP